MTRNRSGMQGGSLVALQIGWGARLFLLASTAPAGYFQRHSVRPLCLGLHVRGTVLPSSPLTCTPPAAHASHVPSLTGKRTICRSPPLPEPSRRLVALPHNMVSHTQVYGCVQPATWGQTHSTRAPWEQEPRRQPAFGPGDPSPAPQVSGSDWCSPPGTNHLPAQKIL